MLDEPELLYPSLTPLVLQVRWKCQLNSLPALTSSPTMRSFSMPRGSRSAVSSARNQFSTSLIIDHRLRDDDLVVLTRFVGDSIKDWAVARISLHDGHFHHRSEYTFFTLQGALKHFCELVGEEVWKFDRRFLLNRGCAFIPDKPCLRADFHKRTSRR